MHSHARTQSGDDTDGDRAATRQADDRGQLPHLTFSDLIRRGVMRHEPSPQFDGTFNEAEVHYDLRDGKITPFEFALTAVIRSLDSPDKGCYASNPYLAEWLSVTENHITTSIRKLIRMGYIIRDGYIRMGGKPRRVLRSKWKAPRPGFKPSPDLGYNPDVSNAVEKQDIPGKQVPRGSKAKKAKGGQEVFFSEKTDGQQTSPFDHACASYLSDALKSKGILTPRSIRKWARGFQKLRTKDVPEERIRIVLEWYCKHIRDEFVPVAHCGNSFASKFSRIEDAMARNQKLNPDVEITDKAKSLAESIQHWGWPKGSKGQLAKAIQVSYNNLRDLVDKLVKLAGYSSFKEQWDGRHQTWSNKKGDGFANFVCTNLTVHGLGMGFVEIYLRRVFQKRASWDGWSGDLMRDAISLDCKLFETWGREVAQKYRGNVNDWDKLVEKVKNADT